MLPYISRYTQTRLFCNLVRGCPGSQLSMGFEINEDILRYATVHTLIYRDACFWTPLENWLPGQPLEIIYVCVHRLIYGSIALDFSYGKENEINAMLYWVYTDLYSVQISIYRYTTLNPSMKPVYLGIYVYEQVQDRIYAYERCISAYKSVYTRIYAYVTFCKKHSWLSDLNQESHAYCKAALTTTAPALILTGVSYDICLLNWGLR